ncbi:hypothetical protein GNI_003530 [Gregarina niphandrodes]|uniref:Uncharacterized protein n=1 Tax=Gregarina niphandrodes TaxID=110365 RepID=A0A023BDM9_GRENI|nr:hypothetical protein GNI_003530 [Gregarina niphandrodes]EZG89013.1 hypothetical protein GNI_003530 [Gregarina niphandrodes]|eukprot:XP_011128520.1 hypothetical protein GNI_003530 [Gregarina niphandrodes]
MLDHWCWGTKSYRPDLELRRKQLPPVVLPTANARVFAISNALDIEQDPGKYKCQLYLPLTLPPTVRRKNFSYDYILAIANKQPDSKRRDGTQRDSKKTPGEATNLELKGRPLTTNSLSRSFGEDSVLEDNFSGSKQCSLTLKVEPSLALLAPLTEWIPTFVKYRDLSKALLPPPPIFPPLPNRPGTPSSLALDPRLT